MLFPICSVVVQLAPRAAKGKRPFRRDKLKVMPVDDPFHSCTRRGRSHLLSCGVIFPQLFPLASFVQRYRRAGSGEYTMRLPALSDGDSTCFCTTSSRANIPSPDFRHDASPPLLSIGVSAVELPSTAPSTRLLNIAITRFPLAVCHSRLRTSDLYSFRPLHSAS